MQNSQKILFVVTRRIGDSIAITPAIRAAYKHYPNAEVVVMCKKGLADLFVNNKFISKVKEIRTPKAKLLYFISVKNRFDVCFAYTDSQSFVKLANKLSKKTYSFFPDNPDKSVAGVYYKEKPNNINRPHIILENLELLLEEGIQHAGYRMNFNLTQTEINQAEFALQSIKQDSSVLICLKITSHPQKSFRDWSVERFSELISLIVGVDPGARFVVVGAKQESEAIDDLCKKHSACTVSFYDQSIRETAAIVFASDLYLGVDTGITQIASCGNFPIVGLYHCLIGKERAGPLENPCDFSLNMTILSGRCERKKGSMDTIFATDVFDSVKQAIRLS